MCIRDSSDNESTDNKLYKPTAPNRSVKISGLKHIGLLFDKEDGLSFPIPTDDRATDYFNIFLDTL